MLRVRVAADIPVAERPDLKAPDPQGPAFQARAAAMKQARGAAFSICDL
jgi:peptidylprolyl isomerase